VPELNPFVRPKLPVTVNVLNKNRLTKRPVINWTLDDITKPSAVIYFVNHLHFGNSNGIYKAEAV
jgi:hypothetical protein